MTYKDIMEMASSLAGWNEQRQLEVLLEFLETQPRIDRGIFRQYIIDLLKKETGGANR